MSRRFSSEELHYLRNQVPIRQLIKNHFDNLAGSEGRYRCPRCHRNDANINAAHNLLRCFDCAENFNPIEITMQVLGLDFVESVNWLMKRYPMPKTAASDIASIGQILPEILPPPSTKQKTAASADRITDLSTRLSSLEKKVRDITTQLEKIRTSLPE